MVYGYCRVSTKSQVDGYSLDAQEKEILTKYENAIVYKEQYTGTKLERPIFNKVLSLLKPHDTLVVCKLDRFARNTVEGIEVIEGLFKRNVSIHILNVGLLDNTPMGKFFLTTMLAIAELERNMIIERTQTGKLYARENGLLVADGRPKTYSDEDRDKILKFKETHSYSETVKEFGISKSTLIRMKKDELYKDYTLVLSFNRWSDKFELTDEKAIEILLYKKKYGHVATCKQYKLNTSSIIRTERLQELQDKTGINNFKVDVIK